MRVKVVKCVVIGVRLWLVIDPRFSEGHSDATINRHIPSRSSTLPLFVESHGIGIGISGTVAGVNPSNKKSVVLQLVGNGPRTVEEGMDANTVLTAVPLSPMMLSSLSTESWVSR